MERVASNLRRDYEPLQSACLSEHVQTNGHHYQNKRDGHTFIVLVDSIQLTIHHLQIYATAFSTGGRLNIKQSLIATIDLCRIYYSLQFCV